MTLPSHHVYCHRVNKAAEEDEEEDDEENEDMRKSEIPTTMPRFSAMTNEITRISSHRIHISKFIPTDIDRYMMR